MSSATAQKASTPVRRKNVNKENIYFEPGKLGRKTGITLADTGVRDEFGFEPVSGIFSSPIASPPKANIHNGNSTLTSSDMVLVESSGAEPTETLLLRKTPHLPPRSQTPRHTNIGGSPIRNSPARAESRGPLSERGSPSRLSNGDSRSPNRLLDFSKDDKIMRSIERSPSPAKAKFSVSTKTGKPRKSIFDFDLSPKKKAIGVKVDAALIENIEEEEEVSEVVDQILAEDEVVHPKVDERILDPALLNGDDYVLQMDDNYDGSYLQEAQDAPQPIMEQVDESNIKRKRGRPRISDLSILSTTEDAVVLGSTSISTPGQSGSGVHPVSPSSKRHPSLRQRDLEHSYLEPEVDDPMDEISPVRGTENLAPSNDAGPARTYRDLYSGSPEYTVSAEDIAAEAAEPEEPEDKEAARPKKRSKKANLTAKPRKTKPRLPPSARDPDAPIRSVRDSERPYSPSEDTDGANRKGPRSNVRLMSATPFEDEGAKVTRSGRTSVKPLQYWRNEGYTWRHGEVDGIVRATDVEQKPKRKPIARGRGKGRLGSIAEDEEEEEDLLPEQWEEELGVITGPVRPWDADVGAGIEEQSIDEDVAFAASSIAVRDVQNSEFRYAKVMTLPFFGAGMVEIPPEGYKRSKNSRKMQMTFFVHEGKVTVEVAGIVFGLTKGGVWQVPRGNNYAITNESKRFPAKVFFAQGCERDVGMED